LMYVVNDKLSAHLGVDFAGVVSGDVTNFATHEITDGVTGLQFIAGSGVLNAVGNPDITILGSFGNGSFVDLNNNNIKDRGEIGAPPVIGILNNYPNTKIFFMSDTNCLELLPQPFTENVIHWLFQ